MIEALKHLSPDTEWAESVAASKSDTKSTSCQREKPAGTFGLMWGQARKPKNNALY